MSQYPQRIGEPDCRDYLRTGRCKYGESCKYHHPANVQSGGGIKTPLDPNEPPFPLRPNEPDCQYYLKHGTCKFGQTCKFHHPPELLGVGSNVNKHQGLAHTSFQSSPLLGGASANSSAGNDLVVILPQRPNEPDCIYFLRNGRCKYGATCKFHHPLTCHAVGMGMASMNENGSLSGLQKQKLFGRHAGTQSRGRSYSAGSPNDANFSNGGPTHVTLPFISGQGIMTSHGQQQGQGHSGPTHILVPEGQIAVMLNPVNKGNASFHNSSGQFLLSRSGQQGNPNASASAGNNPNPQSTIISSPGLSSSIASSYETASSFELMGGAGTGSSASENNHLRWQRSSSQQQLSSAYSRNFSSQNSNNVNVGPRHAHAMASRQQIPHSYVMMTRPGSNEMLYTTTTDMNMNMNHHNQNGGFIKVLNMESPRDRRTVSLGSTAELSVFSHVDSNSHNNMNQNRNASAQSIHHTWESSPSLSAMSTTRFRDDIGRMSQHSRHTNSYHSQELGIGPASLDATAYRERDMESRNVDSEASTYNNKSTWNNHESRYNGMDHLHGSSSIPSNLSRQDYQNRLETHLDHSPNRNYSDSTLGIMDSSSMQLEDDGLSTMTSALLNMLDTSEEPEGYPSSPNFSRNSPESRSKKKIDMDKILSTSDPRSVKSPSLIHRTGLSSQMFSSSEENNHHLEKLSENNSYGSCNLNGKLAYHTLSNEKQQIQSQSVVAPQAATSNIGLYLS